MLIKCTFRGFDTVLAGWLVFCLLMPFCWPGAAALAQSSAEKPVQPLVGIQRPVSLAVLELEPQGVDPVLASALGDLLRIQLREHPGLRLLERARMRDVLQEQHFQFSEHCGDSESCLQKTGLLLGVQRLVVGAVHQVDGFYSTHLRLLDVASGQITGAATRQCHCSAEDMLTRTPQLLTQQLLAAVYAEMPRGSLQIDSTPPGAEVILNQTLMGRTPLRLPQVAAGKHALLLRQSSYQVLQHQLDLNPEQHLQLQFKLQAADQNGMLNVRTEPAGVQVFINGVSHGPAPLTLDALEPGLHTLRFEHPDYLSQSHRVLIEAGKTRSFDTRLVPVNKPRGTLQVQSNPLAASLFINGRYAGRTPLVLMLDAGEYQLSLRKAGYQNWEDTVMIQSDQLQLQYPRLSEEEHAWVLPSVLLGSVVALIGGAILLRQSGQLQRADTLDISLTGLE